MNTLGNTSEQDQTNETSEEELNMHTGQETVKTGQDHLDETVYMGKTCLSNLHDIVTGMTLLHSVKESPMLPLH